METSQAAESMMDMKMWMDIENIIQDFSAEDMDGLTDCSRDDQLFVQLADFGHLKSEMFVYQSDASMYDDRRRQQKEQEEFQGGHVMSVCDLYAAATTSWSDMKLWDDPLLAHVKEEQPQAQPQPQHPSPSSPEFNSQAAPSATLKVLRESRQLGIPSDPCLWSTMEVQRWAASVLEKKSFASSHEIAKRLIINGSALCSLQSEDLEGWVRNDEVARALFVELELWRCAQHFSASWPGSSSLSYGYPGSSSSSSSSSRHLDSYGHVMSMESPSNANNNPLEKASLIQTFTSFEGHPSNNNNNHLLHCTKVTSAPNRPTTLAVQPSYFLDSQRHLSGTNDPVLPQFSFFMSPSAEGYNSNSPASNSSIIDFNYSPMTEVPGGSTNTSPTSSVPEFYEVFGSQNDLSEKAFNDAPVQTARQGNQLWQFLKELLLQPCHYENCIRWLDRSKGIFKIEDSIKVAKLWGQRKNRPAMNYDKLSRSIRQYYKKGIIKKTSQSKRLVYQFCQKYA